MNRRSFFNSLAAFAGAASLSPHIFIPKFEPVKWKGTKPLILDPKAFFGEWAFVGDYYSKMEQRHNKSISNRLKVIGSAYIFTSPLVMPRVMDLPMGPAPFPRKAGDAIDLLTELDE